MTIKEFLKFAREKYSSSDSFLMLDVEVILCHVLGGDVLDRSDLVLRENQELGAGELQLSKKMLEERVVYEKPLAYVLREKEFYGRKFYVDSRVLIPRPETEIIIDVVKELFNIYFSRKDNVKILDVGTGSSCIATTLKLEIPDAKVTGIDISKDALAVAERNAKSLGADVELIKSDLLEQMKSQSFQIVVANLPYVDRNWNWTSKEIRFEPSIALFAEDGGLDVIKDFTMQLASAIAKEKWETPVYAVLEFDPSQKDAFLEFVATANKENPSIKIRSLTNLVALSTTKFVTVLEIIAWW